MNEIEDGLRDFYVFEVKLSGNYPNKALTLKEVARVKGTSEDDALISACERLGLKGNLTAIEETLAEGIEVELTYHARPAGRLVPDAA